MCITAGNFDVISVALPLASLWVHMGNYIWLFLFQATQIWTCESCVKMVSYNEPSNLMHRKTLRGILDTSLKQRYHRHGIYIMELIYVQTKLKSQGSPKLAWKLKNKDWDICIWYRHTQN